MPACFKVTQRHEDARCCNPAQVALLFLTRDWLPYEPVWAAFLASVPDLGGQQGWRLLFSLYVHAPPGNTWGPGSLFTGREIAGRIPVEWGQWSVVRAPRPSSHGGLHTA